MTPSPQIGESTVVGWRVPLPPPVALPEESAVVVPVPSSKRYQSTRLVLSGGRWVKVFPAPAAIKLAGVARSLIPLGNDSLLSAPATRPVVVSRTLTRLG